MRENAVLSIFENRARLDDDPPACTHAQPVSAAPASGEFVCVRVRVRVRMCVCARSRAACVGLHYLHTTERLSVRSPPSAMSMPDCPPDT